MAASALRPGQRESRCIGALQIRDKPLPGHRVGAAYATLLRQRRHPLCVDSDPQRRKQSVVVIIAGREPAAKTYSTDAPSEREFPGSMTWLMDTIAE
jgi:hypothetical protein